MSRRAADRHRPRVRQVRSSPSSASRSCTSPLKRAPVDEWGIFPTGRSFTDTERLEKQRLKFETKTTTGPGYTVILFGRRDVMAITGLTVRGVVDSAMRASSTEPRSGLHRVLTDNLSDLVKMTKRAQRLLGSYQCS